MPDEILTFDFLHPQPLLIVISGPSGVGKDAVLESLKNRHLDFHFVVTCTTRPPRQNERQGIDYFFVSKEVFEEMIARGEFIEYAMVYDQYKGVPKSQIKQAIESGKDVIMRVDVQGAARIHALCPDAILIFLIPANTGEWLQRLQARQTETPENLELRLKTVHQELQRIPDFDYIVVNTQDCLEEAVDTIVAIITAEHHRGKSRKITL
ncbi:MAG TPA: guanylate kinase [Anaerolineaceae bacterium]|nr:guanylate kinase [Anaerolineaceae bacterium]